MVFICIMDILSLVLISDIDIYLCSSSATWVFITGLYKAHMSYSVCVCHYFCQLFITVLISHIGIYHSFHQQCRHLTHICEHMNKHASHTNKYICTNINAHTRTPSYLHDTLNIRSLHQSVVYTKQSTVDHNTHPVSYDSEKRCPFGELPPGVTIAGSVSD